MSARLVAWVLAGALLSVLTAAHLRLISLVHQDLERAEFGEGGAD